MADQSSQDLDLQQYGKEGIDTQYERDLINYRPNIRYKKQIVYSDSSGLSADTASQSLDELTNITSPHEIWSNVVNVVSSVEKLDKKLSEKLANATATVSDRNMGDVKEAAEKFGYQITSAIPFKLYQDSFSRLGSWEAACVQEAWEAYQADVNGTINAELYTDVKEIQADWEDMIPFVKKGLFGQIVAPDKYPTDISVDDVNLQAIQTSAQQLLDAYSQMLQLMKVNEDLLFQLSINEYGSQRYFDLENEVKKDKRKLDDIKRRLYTLGEVTSLIQDKSSNVSDSLEFIDNSIDFAPYEDEEQDIVLHLMRQYVSQDNMLESLKKLQAILKLSVDKKIIDTDSDKKKLRGVASRSVKNKINQTLVSGIHLRNEVFGDVQGIMEYFDGIPNSDAFEQVASHIVSGMVQAENSYQAQSMDFYKIHKMDTEIRTTKLQKIIDKDGARNVYKIVDAVISYVQQTNKWPNTDNLVDWVNSFIEYYKTL